MANVGKKFKANLNSDVSKYNGCLAPSKNISYNQKNLVSSGTTKEPGLSFSFRYFSQEQNFGLRDGCDGSWFVSFLNGVRELCCYTLSEFITNKPLQNKFRFHPVNFSKDAVSITRASLKSIPEEIRDNDKEYPFFELNVTTSRGRYFGFFDNSVFYVVYLDRHHNMYPMDRGITRTFECESDFDSLLRKLRNIVSTSSKCSHAKCEISSMVEKIPGLGTEIIYIALDNEELEMLFDLQTKHTWEEIFKQGMFNLL
ncbi:MULTISPECIES: hypothetical protein [unclassified Fibrobacter]|uniref:hypothetical protein n=1 Tax=unclassified Fibrobacter TaxID=2634177 RepID=UPI000D6BC169|nr:MULTISPECIES: hypothetical protein [unclassified Fibrobacter]PWJ64461.1 hypothetical protein BGX12_11562 [Fibrobacter sp. UWR4]PZW69338.1 hypothetical protein C8E88_101462 [Fibrobacter sp. UWR1]